jgi:LPS sulfotransferase NodH
MKEQFPWLLEYARTFPVVMEVADLTAASPQLDSTLKRRILCVVSNARSGSTALRSALCTDNGIRDFGEIFHSNRALTPLPFLDFLERWPAPLAGILDWDACTTLAGAYLRQLVFESQGLRPLIDIKHNCWGTLRPLWQFPHDPPIFMSALKAERAIFIQLKRNNVAEQIISYYIAMNTQVWHTRLKAVDIPNHILGKRLDPALARRFCVLFERAEALIDSFLADYPWRLALDYESIFANGMLTHRAAAQVSDAIGAMIQPAILSQQQNNIDKREIISNYDEVCEIAEAVHATRRAF